MSKIHVATREGQSEYGETEVRAMWNSRQFPQDAKYWREGMADWQPLSSWLSAGDAPFNPYASTLHAAAEVPLSGGRYSYTRPLRGLTRFLLVMLWISLACEVVRIGSDAMQLSLLGSTYTVEEGTANDARQSVVATVWMVIYFATSIPFLMWIHRINVNCRGFGAQGMMMSPGWAVGSFFVPILNLFRPYQAMKQVWQVSQDPENWYSQKASGLLGLWWGLWLLSCVMGQVSFRLSLHADTVEALVGTTGLSIAEAGVSIVLTLTAIQLVRRIFRMQEALVNREPDSLTGIP